MDDSDSLEITETVELEEEEEQIEKLESDFEFLQLYVHWLSPMNSRKRTGRAILCIRSAAAASISGENLNAKSIFSAIRVRLSVTCCDNPLTQMDPIVKIFGPTGAQLVLGYSSNTIIKGRQHFPIPVYPSPCI